MKCFTASTCSKYKDKETASEKGNQKDTKQMTKSYKEISRRDWQQIDLTPLSNAAKKRCV